MDILDAELAGLKKADALRKAQRPPASHPSSSDDSGSAPTASKE
jgi:hypothetical protein